MFELSLASIWTYNSMQFLCEVRSFEIVIYAIITYGGIGNLRIYLKSEPDLIPCNVWHPHGIFTWELKLTQITSN